MKTKNNISLTNTQFQEKSKIFDAVRGIYINKTLRAAIKLGLFTLLQNKPLTGEEIKTALNLNGRGLFDFLDALVSLELLNRDGNGKDALYSNTEEVSLFLVKGSSQYIGWYFENKMQEFEQMWGALDKALKTGKPQRQDLKNTGKNLFEIAYDSKDKSRASVKGMNFRQMGSFKNFVKRFDFSGYNTLCDIGGGNGLFSIMVAEQHKHMKCITFDLPALDSFARDKIKENDLLDRITVVNGNFFKDDFPKTDMITMGNILHDWNLEQKKILIAKAYHALPVGGALVVIESIIDNERRKNTDGLLMSLNMLLATEGGFDFTAADFDSWVKEAGFKKTTPLSLSGDSSAVIAYK
ncbi:MAG: methyltransferase [Candidatus Aminicenantes bacterium]|nr:methyltransferase [Candidatus Aminicenantes bacterium]NIM81007.1 methyltransferase [Candidatus Aminicenantes bacterium]NIN20386.1 methyltransferase [Candidatus Aminicenantes bacterium]NIN44159.1 methyltransferase [Candidatus Aminicenantes bacterium]NIN86977.1 methyltransferase [Candidatus Aminicenantes bacterium]